MHNMHIYLSNNDEGIFGGNSYLLSPTLTLADLSAVHVGYTTRRWSCVRWQKLIPNEKCTKMFDSQADLGLKQQKFCRLVVDVLCRHAGGHSTTTVVLHKVHTNTTM